MAPALERVTRPATPPAVAVVRAERQIGERLAAQRAIANLTSAQLASRAGIARSTLSRLENGQGASLEIILRVADCLGILEEVVEAFCPSHRPG